MIPSSQLTSRRLPTASSCCFANSRVAAAVAAGMDLGGGAGILGSSSSTGDGGGGSSFSPTLFLSSGTNEHGTAARHNNGLLFGHSSRGYKQPRGEEADAVVVGDYGRWPKMARGDAMVTPPVKPDYQQKQSLFPDGQQMLCFSSTTGTNAPFPAIAACDDDRDDGVLSCHHHQQPPLSVSFSPAPNHAHLRNADLGWKSLNGDLGRGSGGCFTASQWMELELQAMIYSCIETNAPIPGSLLATIKTCASSPVSSAYAAGPLMPATAFGWGELQLGHSGSDPEPGRCRRTDGKKWRCSKDAVVNHKYCDRHLNRGRHRSRKPVEAAPRSGNAKASGGAPRNNNNNNSNAAPSPAASAVSSTGSTINSCATQLQKNSLPSSPEHSSTHFIRMPVIKDERCGHHQFTDSQSFATPIPSLSQITEETSSPGPRKQGTVSEHRVDDKEFGISSQAFLNSFARYQSLHSSSFPSFEFIERRDCQPSQLPIFFVPNAASDLSTSSSPTQTQDDLTKLSKMTEPLSLGTQKEQQQISWVPISWDVSMGGPLGEALSRAYNGDCFINKASPLAQSPDEVLQRTTTFNSSSDSAGSSPRADDHFRTVDLQPNIVDFNPFLSY